MRELFSSLTLSSSTASSSTFSPPSFAMRTCSVLVGLDQRANALRTAQYSVIRSRSPKSTTGQAQRGGLPSPRALSITARRFMPTKIAPTMARAQALPRTTGRQVGLRTVWPGVDRVVPDS